MWCEFDMGFCDLTTNSETIVNTFQIGASFATIISAILVAEQIRSATKLNRGNLTFQKVNEMDALLNKAEYQDIIRRIRLKDDHASALTEKESVQIFEYSEENKQVLYDILNFFEALSAATLRRNLDEATLRQMAGHRIFKIYQKLDPFIMMIRKNFKKDESSIWPYQHYEELYKKWKKYYGGTL